MIRFRALWALPLMLASSTSLRAQAVLRPVPSGRGSSEVTLHYPQPAGTTAASATPAAPAPKPLFIRLDYGQPHLRGRTLHTDSLVPYDKPWRLGANRTTTLTSDVDLVLGGATVPKGTYVLYAIPSRTTWKLVVQRNVGQEPTVFADSNDVVRLDLQHTMLTGPIEGFAMWVIPSLDPGPARGELRFAWGTDQLTVPWSLK